MELQQQKFGNDNEQTNKDKKEQDRPLQNQNRLQIAMLSQGQHQNTLENKQGHQSERKIQGIINNENIKKQATQFPLVKQHAMNQEQIWRQKNNFPPNYRYPYNEPMFINQRNQQKMRYDRFLQYQRQRYEMEMRMRAGPFNSYSILQNQNKSEQMYSNQSQVFQANGRKRSNRKYLRSTNNSHKKYLTILKRLFFSVMSPQQINEFQETYSKYKCSRTYYFIILVYMKFKFSQKLRQLIRNSFIEDMKEKIKAYELEMQATSDERFKNYRRQEVYQISFSIKAIHQFYDGSVQKAIETIYKKDKQIIVKKTLFDHSVSFILALEKQMHENPGQMIQKPYSEQLGQQLRANNVGFVFPQPKDKLNQANAKRQEYQLGEEEPVFNVHQEIDKILMNNQEQEQNHQSSEQFQIFPPVPPSFYLPAFSNKYSSLFRKCKSIRIWASIGKNIQKKNRQLSQQSVHN